jgi:uncharacterized protein
MKTFSSIDTLLESHYPGLMAKLEAIIRESEQAYCKNTQADGESFLWEHTTQVASMAMKLAEQEGRPPLLPVIAALFHDCGKFDCGCYHEDDTPEEEHSARQARRLLTEARMPEPEVEGVVSGLKALYSEGVVDDDLTAIVHDADFLVKSGPMGIAGFFTKAALRGRSVRQSILRCLSKELTYALHLPANMRTGAGKAMAKSKGTYTFSFFKALLKDLRDSNIADYHIRELEVPIDDWDTAPISIILVTPPHCPQCGEEFNQEFSFRKEIKCTKLVAELSCRCKNQIEISFCLPEIHRGG